MKYIQQLTDHIFSTYHPHDIIAGSGAALFVALAVLLLAIYHPMEMFMTLAGAVVGGTALLGGAELLRQYRAFVTRKSVEHGYNNESA